MIAHSPVFVPVYSLACSRPKYERFVGRTNPKPYSPSLTVGAMPTVISLNCDACSMSQCAAMNPACPPPACMCMPSAWKSPQAIVAPYWAGGFTTPREMGSAYTMNSAPCFVAIAPISSACASIRPK